MKSNTTDNNNNYQQLKTAKKTAKSINNNGLLPWIAAKKSSYEQCIQKIYIDVQVRLVRLQRDNFRLFPSQQTNKWINDKLPFELRVNGKRFKENRLGYRFPFDTEA